MNLEVAPFSQRAELELVVDYFLTRSFPQLQMMGVDPARLPARDSWLARLLPDLQRPDREKQTFYVGWRQDGQLIGHSNLNRIQYGHEAYVHLHSWDPARRGAGLGTELLRRSIALYASRFALPRLFCEPFAENAAPNRVLVKAGFRLIGRYRTTPGLINFEQEVNRYVCEPGSVADSDRRARSDSESTMPRAGP